MFIQSLNRIIQLLNEVIELLKEMFLLPKLLKTLATVAPLFSERLARHKFGFDGWQFFGVRQQD